jgi:predicted nucleotidyltransferase
MTPYTLDTKTRDVLVQSISACLERAVEGSVVLLRGSLASGNADAWSDIDIMWEIPDGLFKAAVERIEDFLSQAQPVESLRSAPDFQKSDRRRLFFAQFEDMPLFWRADIDVLARSVQRDLQYDVGNEAAWGNDWSLTHSALMNAIAAVKALLRGKEDMAGQLLGRGFDRIGLATPEGDPQELILKLAEGVAVVDVTMAILAGRIVELHRQAFGEGDTGR